MRGVRPSLLVAGSLLAIAAVLPVGSAHARASVCSNVLSGAVTRPGPSAAWRAELEARTAVFDRMPAGSGRPSRRLSPSDAPWLLILGVPRVAHGSCWLHVRLPWRPNAAAGWVAADKVFVQPTPWRIEISRGRRTLTLFRAGKPVRTMSVVVGKPSSPTPGGLFAVVWAIRWHPQDFLGSWVLELTAHSDQLRRFDGGDGTVGIHGRGGTSLRDPLGAALSHGCIRLSNASIDWLVRTVGGRRLPGTPVRVG
jgi:lipoprotein-anchoring transpeptidase ErfK/SrfK